MRVLFQVPILLAMLFACQRKTVAKTSTMISNDSVLATTPTSVPSTPACVLQKIDSIKQQQVWNPPAEIHEYEKDGKMVYLISADCCDRFSVAVDGDCNYLCAPSGGFTGRGDGKCRDFFLTAKHTRLVWKDERARK